MYAFNYKDELYHHGVKGQKWGVRNGPPYPIEDKILRKGTRLNSVSSKYFNSKNYANNKRAMYTYRPDDKWDSKVYEGPFSVYLVKHRGAEFIRKHEYEVVKDLKMPNSKERMSEFKSILDSNGHYVKKELESTRKLLVDYDVGDTKQKKMYRDLDVNNIKTEKDLAAAYSVFNHMMEASWYYKTTREYMDRMSKKYDAMVDDNNQGVYNDAHDPIIIFKANKFLKDVSDPKSPKYLTMDEINKNYDDVKAHLNKAGKNVKL